ncbi:MAG: energy-coupling factor ABC transporter ATP-binding protein [Armatimonadota bacterium]
MGAILSVDHVRFAYPGESASLVDISFGISAGERVALVGANGSGKSTLLHLLDGLYFAQQGSVEAFGEKLTERALEGTDFARQFRQEVGFLFQNSEAQLFSSSVEEEIAFGPLQLGWSGEEIGRRVGDVLEVLEIPHLRRRVPQRLSNGEKKRVALASLLVMSPSVLLLDEPTAGLDPRSQSLLLDLLDELHRSGLTLVTATHDLTLLPHLADRALVLSEDHRLVADAPAGEALADTELLLSVNLIHAHRHRHGELLHEHAHQHITGHEHPHGG